MCYASIEDYANAKRYLERSLQFGAGMDHPLTPIALLKLAEINFRMDDPQTAAFFALEASYSAAIYNQYDILEEALSFGTQLHLSQQPGTVYPPLEQAIVWCNANRAQLPKTALSLRLAECYSEMGDTRSSNRILETAVRDFTKRTGFGSGVLTAKASYISAVNQFHDGNLGLGMQQLTAAVENYRPVSRWLFQLQLTLAQLASGELSERNAVSLFEYLLRDPVAIEWRFEPIEPLVFLATPHLEPFVQWIQMTAATRDYQKVVAICETYRRHLFYSSLPLGGRDLALRWTFHAPLETLTEKAKRQRTDFLTRKPDYKTLSDEAERVRQTLFQEPLKYEAGSDEQKEGWRKFGAYKEINDRLESALTDVALRREAADMVFPPPWDASGMQQILEPNQTVLYVVATPTHHLLLECTAQLGVRLLNAVPNQKMFQYVKKIYKETELDSRQIAAGSLKEDKWQETLDEISGELISDLTLKPYGETPSELIIIPDGLAWYLPFEMLRVDAPENGGDDEANIGDDGLEEEPQDEDEAEEKTVASAKQFLWQKTKMRYAPTLGIAVNVKRIDRPWRRTAFLSGKISDQVDEVYTADQVERLQVEFPAIVDFPDRLDIPSSLFGSVVDEFILLSEQTEIPQTGPLAMALLEKDRNLGGSNLASWLSLPWAGPEHLVLPTFESHGATGVKSKMNGFELFLTSTAAYASGARTILISRWPTRGRSSSYFTESYWRLSRTMPPIDAFRNTLHAMQELELETEFEGRVSGAKEVVSVKAKHPLFWAGYLLMDEPVLKRIEPQVGSEPDADDVEPDNSDKGVEEVMDVEGDGEDGDGEDGDGR
ncbi:MAG: hypothetical protein R3C03_14160 [Pirellulaceae bacterium]